MIGIEPVTLSRHNKILNHQSSQQPEPWYNVSNLFFINLIYSNKQLQEI